MQNEMEALQIWEFTNHMHAKISYGGYSIMTYFEKIISK